LQTTGLASQLLKIKDQYESQVKLLQTKGSAKYTIKEAVQATQNLTSEKTLATSNNTLKTMTFLR